MRDAIGRHFPLRTGIFVSSNLTASTNIMRSREELEKDLTYNRVERLNNSELIVEILIDIRELLTYQSKPATIKINTDVDKRNWEDILESK